MQIISLKLWKPENQLCWFSGAENQLLLFN